MRKVRNFSPRAVYLVTLLLAAGMVGVAIWRVGGGGRFAFGNFRSPDANAPLGMPEKGGPDLRFHFLTPWQAVQIPKAVRFDPPLGSEHAGLIYNAQKYWEMNEGRGGHHTGDDLNGIGGMNTDLGEPVFAVADGLVIYSGEPSPGWGNVVVIAHLAPDGLPVQSMYAHLDRIRVAKDSLVARGEKIGTVGTANGYYPAHLHFEMRASDGIDIGVGYAMFPLNRLDPAATIEKFRNSPAEEMAPSPRSGSE